MAIKFDSLSKKPAPTSTSSKPAKASSKKPSVASVFNADSSDEEEEMPEEARMRMKNVGRDTITSSGPNSFGKTRQGFVDAKKLFERQLKEAMDEVSGDQK